MINEHDVKRILATKKMNLTARRWLDNKEAQKRILRKHQSWNDDHLKLNLPDATLTLEESVNYYLEHPSLIDTEKEPPK